MAIGVHGVIHIWLLVSKGRSTYGYWCPWGGTHMAIGVHGAVHIWLLVSMGRYTYGYWCPWGGTHMAIGVHGQERLRHYNSKLTDNTRNPVTHSRFLL